VATAFGLASKSQNSCQSCGLRSPKSGATGGRKRTTMGWNDRLPDCDNALPSDEERQAYFDWQEYQHYLAMLEAEIEQQSAPPVPERMGLSSQTIDPDCYKTSAKDIYEQRFCNTPQKKEALNGQESEDQAQDKGQDQRQDQSQRG
jgi:hypothetical protein